MRRSVWIDEREVAGPEGLHSPVLLVQQVVVEPAQQGQVVVVGFALVEPVHHMMCITPGGSEPASRPPTAVVADHQIVELGRPGAPLGAHCFTESPNFCCNQA